MPDLEKEWEGDLTFGLATGPITGQELLLSNENEPEISLAVLMRPFIGERVLITVKKLERSDAQHEEFASKRVPRYSPNRGRRY